MVYADGTAAACLWLSVIIAISRLRPVLRIADDSTRTAVGDLADVAATTVAGLRADARPAHGSDAVGRAALRLRCVACDAMGTAAGIALYMPSYSVTSNGPAPSVNEYRAWLRKVRSTDDADHQQLAHLARALGVCITIMPGGAV